jgi:hypothetical protein
LKKLPTQTDNQGKYLRGLFLGKYFRAASALLLNQERHTRSQINKRSSNFLQFENLSIPAGLINPVSRQEAQITWLPVSAVYGLPFNHVSCRISPFISLRAIFIYLDPYPFTGLTEFTGHRFDKSKIKIIRIGIVADN